MNEGGKISDLRKGIEKKVLKSLHHEPGQPAAVSNTWHVRKPLWFVIRNAASKRNHAILPLSINGNDLLCKIHNIARVKWQ